MKSLRQLLRRSQSNNAGRSPKRRTSQHPSAGATKRRLSTQTLEQRQLLAGDLQLAHNYWNSYDVNQDLQISPSDALSVINYLATTNAQGEQVSGASVDTFVGKKVDVNADGNVTPSDALSVINALARGEQMTQLAELLLTARDANDNLLPVSNGIVQAPGVGKENSFFLEVSYNDLRTFGDDLGAFSIFPDIGVDKANVLQPVLRETQQIIIGEEIRSTASGFVTVGREGTTDTVNITIGQIQGGFATALSNALINTFGMTAGDFAITEPTALKGENGLDLGFEIQYIADSFGNVDIPDLTFTANFDNSVPIEFREFAPFLADGVTPNSAAVRFNLDTRSRTLNNNQEFYNLLNRGTFDLATGFTDIGGVGGAFPRGVRDVDANGVIIEPFDAFRIEVFLNQELSDASPLVIDVNPGEGVDPLTLYGSNDVVTEDMITIDADARVTISTGATAINNPPTVTGPVILTATEDDAASTPSLLTGASDLDGDTLSVTGFSFTGGNTAGVSLSGNSLSINPSAYNGLKVGESEIITASFTISDGKGGTVPQTATLTISGVNDAPDAGAAISETRSENAVQFTIALLQNASDPDGDTLDAINITPQNGTGSTIGITVDDVNNQLVVDPSAYSALETGQSEVIVYDFTITDNNGGTVASTVTIQIDGDTPNRNPVVSGPVSLSLSEDDADTTLDLLTNASDPDVGDVLSVSGLTLTGGDASGITVNGNSLSISPNAYNSLAVGDSETITYSYNVVDQENGIVAQTATITISGANDAPVAAAPVTVTVSEDDNSTNVDLLTGASDPDTSDTVSIANLARRSGDDSGISANGASGLTIDPSAYNDLAVGESAVIIYDYDLTDGNGGVTPQSATITITGVNDAPTVGNALTLTVTEDDGVQTIDLLQGAADVDTSDTLTVANLTANSPFSIVNSNSLTFNPSFYNSLAATESEEVVFTYNVVDGNGGSAAQSLTVTINGVNDAPVVTGPLSFSFVETDPVTVRSLLQGASDPDTSDILSVANVVVTGDDSGITRNGADLTIDPDAYAALEVGQSSVITFTYDVTDGTANTSQTTTVTITGGLVAPTVTAISKSFNENDASTTVNLLEGAADPNNDPLFIVNANIASGDSRGVTVDVANSRLLINPSAYADMEDGETEVIVVNYDVSDDKGNTTPNTATITIVGQTIVLSTISGQLFVDHIENVSEVLNGAAPIRNGVKDDDEKALGGVTIRLLEVTSSGEAEVATVLTDMDGSYSFTGLLPGTYIVEYDIPESVQHTGSTRGQIVIGEEGGANASGPALGAIGLVGVQQRLDLLAKTYIASGIIDTSNLSGGLAGGSVQLNADGTQRMFIAGEGFDAEFAEVVLNDARDAALLTVIDSQNNVRSARLTLDQFVVTGDGMGVRFFGSMDDFDFNGTTEELIRSEFEHYRNAIDKVHAAGL
ncbi:MAG: cadherin-like domain-containing protein [Planctomycetales bacterium]|nr:cadherin-like domain-containing protein [Planctomycetales bacterium]